MDSKCVLLIYFWLLTVMVEGQMSSRVSDNKTINIGAIVELDSRMGKEQKLGMQIAVDTFNNRNLQFKMSLHFRYFNQSFQFHQTILAAKELMKEEKVEAIIVAIDNWRATALVAQAATTAQLPIMSLTATPPITSAYASMKWPNLLQFSHNSTQQILNITSLIHSYSWRRIIVVYEDESANSGTITLLIQALQNIGSQLECHLVLPPYASVSNPRRAVQDAIGNLIKKGCYSRVFVILKVSLPYVSLLFQEAKASDLITNHSVWLMTNFIPSFDHSTMLNMEGALGIMNNFDNSTKAFQIFEANFGLRFNQEYQNEIYHEPSFQALLAYDAIFSIINTSDNITSSSKTSLKDILSSNFTGLSGEVSFNQESNIMAGNPVTRLVNIANANYHEILLDFASDVEDENITGLIASQVIWPGNLTGNNVIPKGWVMPTSMKPLKIGVPIVHHYKNFINYSSSSRKFSSTYNNADFQGFCIDIFREVKKVLDYNLPYEFIPYDGTYDDLVSLVQNKTFDAAVGDIQISAERSEIVDFTFPYEESGLSIIVPVAKSYSSQGAWIVLRPYTLKMWLVTFGVFLYTMMIIWILEHKNNSEFNGQPWGNQLCAAAWFAFNSLYFTLREKISSTQARVVVIFWLFIVLVLTTSYTANLSSMITNERLNQTTIDIEMLRRTNAKIGYDNSTFNRRYLESLFKFDSKNIVGIEGKLEEIHKEFQQTKIGAACLEYAYAQLLLTKYCNQYIMTPPMRRFGGFGFVFPKGSPIAVDVSKALLKLTEKGGVKELKKKYFHTSSDCTYTIGDINNNDDVDPSSLSLQSFRVLFYASGVTTTLCLLLSFIQL